MSLETLRPAEELLALSALETALLVGVGMQLEAGATLELHAADGAAVVVEVRVAVDVMTLQIQLSVCGEVTQVAGEENGDVKLCKK